MSSNSRIATGALVLALAVVPLACGGSSQPAFCGDGDNFRQSVAGFGDSLKTLDPPAIQVAGENLKASGVAMVDAARSDYPDETAAIRKSLDETVAGVNDLETAKQQPAAIAAPVSDAVLLNSNLDALRSAPGVAW